MKVLTFTFLISDFGRPGFRFDISDFIKPDEDEETFRETGLLPNMDGLLTVMKKNKFIKFLMYTIKRLHIMSHHNFICNRWMKVSIVMEWLGNGLK